MQAQRVTVCATPVVEQELRCCLAIGEVRIGITSRSEEDVDLGDRLRVFRTDEQLCDIEIRVESREELYPYSGKKAFDSGSLWTLYVEDDRLIFDFVTPFLGLDPYKRLYVDHRFLKAVVVVNEKYRRRGANISALEYPLDELLVTNWLALGRGVEVHGCGVVDRGSGAHLFLGHSGAGKSTTSGLWSSLREAHVLSDDRIILRLKDSEVWMHGTPWHGEAGHAAPDKAKLQHIFILEHGQHNEIAPMAKSEAVAELFARCFPPFYGSTPLSSTLSYLHRIANLIPCYRYRFVPDTTGVEHIVNFHCA